MSDVPTKRQVSAGGVAYRMRAGQIEVALISVDPDQRWQLPKGLVNKNESNEAAALREVREETGLETELVAPLDKIEYWYYSGKGGRRVRFHKHVHFYLLRYKAGDVSNHDQEVNEARWIPVDEAARMLAFKSEKEVVSQAKEIIAARQRDSQLPL